MDFKIKNRHRLKKKEITEIIDNLQRNFNSNFFNVHSIVEIGFYGRTQLVFIDSKPHFMIYGNRIVFTLLGLYQYTPNNKYVVIDMGAVKFVTKGADVMSPGIIDADKDIQPEDVVWVCDEKNKKPLALGIAIISGENMIKKEKGKAISVFHYVGDTLWNFLKSEGNY